MKTSLISLIVSILIPLTGYSQTKNNSSSKQISDEALASEALEKLDYPRCDRISDKSQVEICQTRISSKISSSGEIENCFKIKSFKKTSAFDRDAYYGCLQAFMGHIFMADPKPNVCSDAVKKINSKDGKKQKEKLCLDIVAAVKECRSLPLEKRQKVCWRGLSDFRSFGKTLGATKNLSEAIKSCSKKPLELDRGTCFKNSLNFPWIVDNPKADFKKKLEVLKAANLSADFLDLIYAKLIVRSHYGVDLADLKEVCRKVDFLSNPKVKDICTGKTLSGDVAAAKENSSEKQMYTLSVILMPNNTFYWMGLVRDDGARLTSSVENGDLKMETLDSDGKAVSSTLLKIQFRPITSFLQVGPYGDYDLGSLNFMVDEQREWMSGTCGAMYLKISFYADKKIANIRLSREDQLIASSTFSGQLLKGYVMRIPSESYEKHKIKDFNGEEYWDSSRSVFSDLIAAQGSIERGNMASAREGIRRLIRTMKKEISNSYSTAAGKITKETTIGALDQMWSDLPVGNGDSSGGVSILKQDAAGRPSYVCSTFEVHGFFNMKKGSAKLTKASKIAELKDRELFLSVPKGEWKVVAFDINEKILSEAVFPSDRRGRVKRDPNLEHDFMIYLPYFSGVENIAIFKDGQEVAREKYKDLTK